MAKSPAAAAPAPAKPTVTEQPAAAPAVNGQAETPLLDQVLANTVQKMDALAKRWKDTNEDPAVGHLYRSLAQAAVIERLTELLDPKTMQKFMRLQNEPLGFLTDQKGGYDLNTVRACIIDGLLSGFYPLNNEWNIIKAKMMPVKNGYARRLKEMDGFADLDLRLELPCQIGPHMTVKAFASWQYNGRNYTLLGSDGTPGRVFPIAAKGGEALTWWGKAERLALKAIFNRLTGSEYADGDDTPEPGGTDLEDADARAAKLAAELKAKVENQTPLTPEQVAWKAAADVLSVAVRAAKMAGVFNDDDWPKVLLSFNVPSKSKLTIENMNVLKGQLENKLAEKTRAAAPPTRQPGDDDPNAEAPDPAPLNRGGGMFPEPEAASVPEALAK